MCTAITYFTKDHYFGRNLDLEYSYHETVTVTPRNYPFNFRYMGSMNRHFAMIGMAFVLGDYPLYYDAINEKGLGMAGLNFPTNAHFFDVAEGKENVATFEFIPWVLSQCENLVQARELLSKINLTKDSFAPELPASPLHWMIADKTGSIVVECVKDGLKVYDNPVGVLTNNPTFDLHLFNLNNYMHLSPRQPENTFIPGLELDKYSNAMGGMGLPGDNSSMSRFVRAAYFAGNSVSGDSESESISQFFHTLTSVEQQRGSVYIGEELETTVYSSCCNLDKGIYYYITYENRQITAVDMHREDLEGDKPVSYELVKGQQILQQN